MSVSSGVLRGLGVYGYDVVEPVVIAALVTGKPLLLIGKAGTGKTFLLNSISEALALEHHFKDLALGNSRHGLRSGGQLLQQLLLGIVPRVLLPSSSTLPPRRRRGSSRARNERRR